MNRNINYQNILKLDSLHQEFYKSDGIYINSKTFLGNQLEKLNNNLEQELFISQIAQILFLANLLQEELKKGLKAKILNYI